MKKYDMENDGERLIIAIPLGIAQLITSVDPEDPEEPEPEPPVEPEPEPPVPPDPTPSPGPQPVPSPPNPTPDPEPEPEPPSPDAVAYRIPTALVLAYGEDFLSWEAKLWYRVTADHLSTAEVNDAVSLKRYVSAIGKYKRGKVVFDIHPEDPYRTLVREVLGPKWGLLEIT